MTGRLCPTGHRRVLLRPGPGWLGRESTSMSLPASGHFPAGAREGFSLPREVLGTGRTALLDPATRSEPGMPQVPPPRLETKSRHSSTGELVHPPSLRQEPGATLVWRRDRDLHRMGSKELARGDGPCHPPHPFGGHREWGPSWRAEPGDLSPSGRDPSRMAAAPSPSPGLSVVAPEPA